MEWAFAGGAISQFDRENAINAPIDASQALRCSYKPAIMIAQYGNMLHVRLGPC